MTGQSFVEWHKQYPEVKLKKNADAVKGADLIVNATQGGASISVLSAIGNYQLRGKVLLDLANPLDFSKGMPPTLSVCNTHSLAEQIQEKFPDLKVVKALNTMSASIMVNPSSINGVHTVFVSGNDAEAKKSVIDLLKSMGWDKKDIIDLGDISTARGTEMLLPVWLRLWGTLGHVNFNFHIQRN
jgi:predicted dinucleotide-binding enzyme